jgi:hypothetical protein
VKLAENPNLDAWKGARLFSNEEVNKQYYITKEEYEEYGVDYFKEHWCSNLPIFTQRNSNLNYDINPQSVKKQKIN